MGSGGPSAQQRAAADAQMKLSHEQTGIARRYDQREQQAYDTLAPFAKSRMQHGLPFAPLLFDSQYGLTARSFDPMRAQTLARFSQYDNLPSGSREAAI